MAPVDRRTFVRRTAAASAAAAGVAMLPPALLGAGTPAAVQGPAGPLWKRSPCPLCSVGCGLLVGIEDGRAGGARGDPDSTVSKGLACARGYYSVQALYGRDRLSRAHVRRGSSLAAVPLSEALDLVAQRLQETVNRHGAESVAVYGSSRWSIADAYAVAKLFKGGIGSNNVENSTRLHAASAMKGLNTSFGLDGAVGCFDDLDHADVFVLWDSNLAETDPVLFSRMLERKRKDRTVRIIDLTTRTTRTSYAADVSLLHAPQSALAVANAICHEIVARKWVNRAFVDRHVAFKRGGTDIGHGSGNDRVRRESPVDATFAEFEASLSAAGPENAQRISGLPADRIRWLASLYADRSRKVMSIWGANAIRHSRGTWLSNALINIHLLVGKIATPGNGALVVTGQPGGGATVHDAGTLCDTLPRGTVTSDADRRRAAAIWGVPAERIRAGEGLPLMDMFRALDRGDIRFLWIQGATPMSDLPNLDRYRAAATKADRFIVVSDAYPTVTTDLAQVVLPAALWFEAEGVLANGERRLQHHDRMVQAPGEALSFSAQTIEVARRLGMGSLFPAGGANPAAALWEEYRRFHADPRSALPAVTDLRSKPGVMWPFVGGRETRWRYNTAHDPAADRSRGAFDFYGHPDRRAWIWLRPYQPPVEVPDREFPFWLTTGSVLEHSGSGTLTQRVPTLHRGAPRSYAEFNREDAERMGIRRGDVVRLTSRRGALQIEARIEYRSQPPRGQVFVPEFDESLPVQRLMPDAFCPLSGQPHTGACAVRVERVRGGNSA